MSVSVKTVPEMSDAELREAIGHADRFIDGVHSLATEWPEILRAAAKSFMHTYAEVMRAELRTRHAEGREVTS